MADTVITSGPDLITDGMLLCLDIEKRTSYPRVVGDVALLEEWGDISGNQNHADLVNFGFIPSPSGIKHGASAMRFDGVDNYLDLGDKFDIAIGTFDFWFVLDNSPASTDRIWGKNQNFECRWTATPEFVVDLGATSSITSTKTDWSAEQWYNITLTWNSSSNVSTLYVQGAQDTTGTATSPVGLTGNFRIGSSLDNSAYMDGGVAIFRIYDRVLSATEVAQNYNATKNRFGL